MRNVLGKRIFLKPAIVFCAIALLVLLCGNAPAAEPSSPLGAVSVIAKTRVPWTIHADKLEYNSEKHLYVARGHVLLSAPSRTIEADRATMNNQTRQADLRGNVTIRYGRNWLKGEHIVWNLDTETGTMDSGVMYFAENNFFVQGSSISKTGPTQFVLGQGFITSCNPGDPAWKVQFKKMEITVGGTAWTTDTSFWAGNHPIAYWPSAVMPVETERQSGFLLPFVGDSTLNGFHFELPYYWAIREDMDATLYTQYLQNRGVMEGAEYRVNNNQLGKGVWMFNYLDDQASKSLLSEQGYPYQTTDRYWVRGKQNIDLPLGWEAKIDLDYVSDRNFLQEFASGSSALANTNRDFIDYFNRGLLYDQTSLVRESDLYLEKRGESDVFSMDTRYWENLEPTVKSLTTQKLPSFDYTVIPTGINGTPLYYSVDSSAVNYWSRQGDGEQRLDLYPQLFYPLHWNNYLNIEPSVGLRGDAYSIQWQEPNSGANYAGRAVPDVDVEMSSRLNKVYPVNFWGLTAVQHTIEPEISYEYATQTLGSQLPQLDRLDLDQSRNGVRYGFTTFLTGKQIAPGDSGTPAVTYAEIARLRVFQFFNIEPPAQPDSLFDADTLMPEGFSPLGVRLDIMPIHLWTLSYDLDWQFRSGSQVQAQDLSASYNNGRGNALIVDYEQIPDLNVNEISLTTYFKVYDNIYLNTYHDFSFQTGLWFTQGYGIRYVQGCWGIGAGYERVGNDNRFLFTVDLMGIGSLGNQVSFFGRPQFGESLPGYQHPETWLLSR
ncbi:MAG: LPS assembly protein LptD [Syntrophobacteraceae bacterium]|nr:LPS assembly protein LptD [Syntrophobacteraceae bacterium]